MLLLPPPTRWGAPQVAPVESLLTELARAAGQTAGPPADEPGAGELRADWPDLRAESPEDAASVVDAVVQLLGVTQEGHGPEGWQQGHSRRMVTWAEKLAVVAGLPPAEVRAVRWGAALHDIGKARVPQAILQKPGPLDPHEHEVILRHPEWGVEMLCHLPFLPAQTLAAVRHHHERWDGQGYPGGLRLRRIPLSARIVALADVYDALTSERPYKPAWSAADAARHLLREAGRQFDPHLAPLFVREVLGFDDLLAPCPR